MIALIVIFVVIGIVAALVSGVFGLDFETVFLWCVIVVCGLVLLLFLNPLYWQAYFRERRQRKERAEAAREELLELDDYGMPEDDDEDFEDDDDERWEREYDHAIDRSVEEYVRYSPWSLNIFSGNYKRYDRMTGRTQSISGEEYRKWREDNWL